MFFDSNSSSSTSVSKFTSGTWQRFDQLGWDIKPKKSIPHYLIQSTFIFESDSSKCQVFSSFFLFSSKIGKLLEKSIFYFWTTLSPLYSAEWHKHSWCFCFIFHHLRFGLCKSVSVKITPIIIENVVCSLCLKDLKAQRAHSMIK